MFRVALLGALLAVGCTAPNPDYDPLWREHLYGVPDGFILVPVPDQTVEPDMYQCKAHLEQCSNITAVVPGACCGEDICYGQLCRAPLHAPCSVDGDCSPLLIGSSPYTAACHMGRCMGQTSGPCGSGADCVSGICDDGSPRRCR